MKLKCLINFLSFQKTLNYVTQNSLYTVGVEADMFQKMQEEIKRLKIIVKGHEKRIKTLEDKLSDYNLNDDDDE